MPVEVVFHWLKDEIEGGVDGGSYEVRAEHQPSDSHF
jgi:hypothetical protein